MRRYIIASHHLLAHGLKDTLNFLTSMDGIIDISAIWMTPIFLPRSKNYLIPLTRRMK